MIPYEDSIARKAVAIVQGQRFFSIYPTAVPRSVGEAGLYSLTIYTMAD